MKVELMQTTDHRMLAADNVTVKLDNKEVSCVESINVIFDAQKHTPRVIMTIIPTELVVSLDGKPLMTIEEWGKENYRVAGHDNYQKNDHPQIIPDDIAE